MKTPPLLLGASLIFWGWQTGFWIPAALIAVIIEGSRLTGFRFDLKPSDFNRIADICAVILLGLFFYLLFARTAKQTIFLFIQWLPLSLSPLTVAQVFSTRGKIGGSAIFWSLRKAKDNHTVPRKEFDLSYLYFAICLLAASAANMRTYWFYPVLIVLSVWALWPARSRRFAPAVWICVLALACLAGYAGQMGLHHLQRIVESRVTALYMNSGGPQDPYSTTTAIGDVGALKLSGDIVARIQPVTGGRPPSLLRVATYNTYAGNTWFAIDSRFQDIVPEKNGAAWKISSTAGDDNLVIVSEYLHEGKGLLKLPSGTSEITGLPLIKVARNPLGTVKITAEPGLVRYQARYGKADYPDRQPAEADLTIPLKEKQYMDRLAEKLRLSSSQPAEAMKTVEDFFQKNFSYSLTLPDNAEENAMFSFLHRTKTGHCEYFATATVLILRAAGIPARYAVGYAVDEFSRMENRFIVRGRHAHAWTLVYINGTWRDFDTTPAQWLAVENSGASLWQPLSDFISWCSFKISEVRWHDWNHPARYIFWIMPAVMLFLLFRLRKTPWKRLKKKPAKSGKVETKEGIDSHFYLIEQKLAEQGYPRQPAETPAIWLARIENHLPTGASQSLLREALDLHYRCRFDPQGLTPDEKQVMQDKVRLWLG